MTKYTSLLKLCPLFGGIGEKELSGMLECLGARIMSAKRNTIIFSEGDEASQVGLVLSGNVQVVRDDYYGNRSIVATIGEGHLFAESFACAEVQKLPVAIIATSDCEIMLLDCKRILTTCSGACEFHTKLINNLLKIVANKNILLNQKIEVTSQRTTREKLMTFLMAQAKKNGSDTFTIPFDRQELADYLEVERSAMSAELGKLCKAGLIETKKNWFHIKRNGGMTDEILHR